MNCHSYGRQDQLLGVAHPGPAVVAQPTLSEPHSVGEAGECWLLRLRSVYIVIGVGLSGKTAS